jgi:transposase
MTLRRHALRDDQWELIHDRLPGSEGWVGANAKDNRLFVDAVIYRYKTGIPWADLPERFGNYQTVKGRHCAWAKTGVWQRVFDALGIEYDDEYNMIDSTIVRAHQHSAGGGKKGIRKQ